MADQLKVFKNEVSTLPASNEKVTIPLVTTTEATQGLVKNITLTIDSENPQYSGIYEYPAIITLNGVPMSPIYKKGFSLIGNQVVDTESALAIEIQSELVKQHIPFSDFIIFGSDGYTRLISAQFTGTETVSTVIQKINANSKIISAPLTTSCYSGGVILKNGLKHYFASNGNNIYILNNNGVNVVNPTLPTTCYACCADDKYIYCKSTGSDSVIYRYNINTFTFDAPLQLSASVPGYGNSNKGFIDYWNGSIYIKINGSDTYTYRINTSTGATTPFSTHINQSEFIGGVVNTNVKGDTYILLFGDTNYGLYNLTTSEQTTYTSTFSTNPTTTNANQVISISSGIVLVNNGSYSQYAIIDFNNLPPTMTQVQGNFPLYASTSALMMGTSFADKKIAPREFSYKLHTSGIEVTL